LSALVTADLALIFVTLGGFTPLSDVLAPLTGHLFGLGVAAVAALVVRRNVPAVFAAGIFGIVAIHTWLGVSQTQQPTARHAHLASLGDSAEPQGLRIVALNARYARARAERLHRYLATASADVVVLSEIEDGGSGVLEALKSAYPFQVRCASSHACTLALLSRLPLAAGGMASISDGQLAFVWARLSARRIALATTIIGTRIVAPARDPWAHDKQTAALIRFLRQIDGPLIVAGDLNTSPWSYAFRSLQTSTRLSPAARLLPNWPAWPVALPQLALDHIFVSAEFKVAAAGTGPVVASDRLPVWAHLTWRPHRPELLPLPTKTLASGFAASPHLGGQFLADLGGEHDGARYLRR
jgi:endonuclease/exonuclease/phosphatase (EEP) superfamily protein YafD